MEILQNDIFGKHHKTNNNNTKEKKKSTEVIKKPFPNVSINDGLDESKLNNDSVFIHRILQRKIIFQGLNSKSQKDCFLKILENELKIKKGVLDPVTASRDSLLSFFTQGIIKKI